MFRTPPLTFAPEPDWIGLLAFRGSLDLRLAAIVTPALFPLGAAAGANGESRFCKQSKRLLWGQSCRLVAFDPVRSRRTSRRSRSCSAQLVIRGAKLMLSPLSTGAATLAVGLVNAAIHH